MKLVRAMSKSVLFTRVKFNRLPSPECLVYKNFSCDISSNGDDVQLTCWQSDRLHKVLEFVSTVHDLCEDEVNSEDEYEENTDQWTWGYFVVGVMSMGKFMLLVFVELDTFGWKQICKIFMFNVKFALSFSFVFLKEIAFIKLTGIIKATIKKAKSVKWMTNCNSKNQISGV